jgi:hypothetical protein
MGNGRVGRFRAVVGALAALVVTMVGGPGQSARAGRRDAAPAPRELPRVSVRDGRFVVKGTDQPFVPRGFNYIRLRPRWHGTFAPKRYDAERAEAMLRDVRRGGFNTLRVFIDPAGGDGVVASADATKLSKAYMGNVIDFLERARRHRVYVVASLLMLPNCRRYGEIVGHTRKGFGHGNEMYFEEGFVRAKARYVADFVEAIEARDPALLPGVLAYELDNETHFVADRPPLSTKTGKLTGPDGKTYDLSSDGDLQRLADAAVIRWADACVEAARRADADAMVSINVFTFAAVGRRGPGRLRKATTKDRRFPARPLALTRTKLDYIDVHFYPFDDGTLGRDLKSIEFEAFRKACKAAGKPMIMGEFGAFKKSWPTLPAAAAAMSKHVRRIEKLGFAGWLYWTYDTDEQAFLWNARSGQGEIFDALGREPLRDGGGAPSRER